MLAHDNDTLTFYSSKPWRQAREQARRAAGYRCSFCGQRSKKLFVDHIRPLREAPTLALEQHNLRTLCPRCHGMRHGKTRDWQADQGCDISGQPRGPAHPWNLPR